MSRLLLYRPRKLKFKRYIANIDQYDAFDSKYDKTYLAAESGRIDILEKYALVSGDSAEINFYMLGEYMPYHSLPKYISKRIDAITAERAYIDGALKSKYIDSIYQDGKNIQFISGYLITMLFNEWRKFSKFGIILILNVLNKHPTKYTGNQSYVPDMKNNFLRTLWKHYDQERSKKIYEYVCSKYFA